MITLEQVEKKYGERINDIYASKADYAKKRITGIINRFLEIYGEGEYSVFSVAGRTEICGNHTDHNYGCVACASVDLDIVAVARKTDDQTVRFSGKGFPEDIVDISDDKTDESKFGTSYALIKGVCAGLKKRGYKAGGFCAYSESDILKGSGLSSSAAFEDMTGTIENYLYNDGKIDVIEIAQISQFSENVYFGKPCGLMDQIACAAGGFVHIDFENKENPKVTKAIFSPRSHGYSLYIVDTGGSHVNLTDDYAGVPSEMKQVAGLYGKQVLRGLTESDLVSKAQEIREKCGDRAFLRALHFIRENERVNKLFEYIGKDDMKGFLSVINESGRSSNELLQNLYSVKSPSEQGIPLACALTETVLGKDGAYRVHGGGFAGTMQAFVPESKDEEFKTLMKKVFGEKSATELNIRKYGQVMIG